MKPVLACLVLTLATNLFAQPPVAPPTTAASPQGPPSFDVVSIRPDQRGGGWHLEPTSDGYTGKNITLLQIVQNAYGISEPQLITGGPSWVDKDKFDIEAKFNPAQIPDANKLTYRQRADMLRPMLADRFQLKVHFITKQFPTFNLIVAKNGPKLAETPPEKLFSGISGVSCLHTRGRADLMSVEGCTMQDLAGSLRYLAGRPVIDQTGLTARYSFTLHWTPDNTPANSPLAGGPSIFTAVQEQLGLKLQPATAPLDILVIDSAERPTPN